MKFLTTIILVMVSLCANSQQSNRRIDISGRVYDAFTEMYVPNTKVTLMTSDSTVIDTSHVGVNNMNNASLTTYYYFNPPARAGKYIIKFENPRYQTCFLNYEIKRLGRQTHFTGPDAKMQVARKKGGLHGENELDEVTIKATKVQFFYKGDTLVYNADAFNLPEGSMLDALIQQMPGAKLTEEGEIYINGKKIDYLTLNGKKMFDGNGQVLLQNLPHYSVKDIKVFEQNKEHQIGMGVESLVKDYVMDVSLKREYDKRNFGQVELGMGTKDRRLGRLFDTYSRESLLTLGYVNLNNVNQTREPGRDGTFSDSDGPRSIVENRQFGMSVNKEKSHGDFSNRFTVTGSVRKSSTDYVQSQKTNLTDHAVYKNASDQQHNRVSAFKANNQLILRKPFFLNLVTNINYEDGKNRMYDAATTYERLIDEGNVVNNAILDRHGKNHRLSLSQNAQLYKLMGWGDEILLRAEFSYNDGKTRNDEAQRITYPRANIDSLYEYVANENVWDKGYQLDGMAKYRFNFPSGFGITLEGSYTQEQSSKNRLRLKDSDEDNCFHSNSIHRESQPRVEFSYKNQKLTITSGVGVKFTNDRMGYQREELDTMIHRNYVDFFPDLRIIWKSKRSNLEFYNKLNSYQKPQVLDLVEKVDDSNPLVMTVGNGKLRKGSMYDYQLWYNYRGGKRDFYLSFDSQSQFCFNYFAKAMLFDETAGSYLITTYNTNGIWASSNRLSIGLALNNAKTIRLSSDLTWKPGQHVNFTGTTQTGLTKNKYKEHTLEENLTFSYQYKKATWRLKGGLRYDGARCNTNSSGNYDGWDIHYGVNMNCYLPWKIQFAGDIGMYSRRGYSLEVLNKDNLIANASLSRSFFKNRMLVKAKVFDIFHELTSIDRYVRGAQITESSYNCIPRYGMLSITYRFGKK